jgi:hypothetical protein
MIDILTKIAISVLIALIMFDAALLFEIGSSDVETDNAENSISADDKPLVSEEDRRMIDEYGSAGIDVGEDRILIITKDDDCNE